MPTLRRRRAKRCALHRYGTPSGRNPGRPPEEKGPLPLELVACFGADIGDGLQCAHRSGIVHRDLKPGNIMLTKGGAKILDFGLAKSGTVNGGAHDLIVTLSSPALSDPLTAEGSLVGTFQYMAPEQVEGKEANASSDIFSFGSVLYEMATGKRAFEGKSQISVASAIMDKEPPAIATVLPTAPPALDHVNSRLPDKGSRCALA